MSELCCHFHLDKEYSLLEAIFKNKNCFAKKLCADCGDALQKFWSVWYKQQQEQQTLTFLASCS